MTVLLRRRVVLCDLAVSHTDFGRFALNHGWKAIGLCPAHDDLPAESVWSTKLGTKLTFLHDPLLHFTWVQIEGDHAAAAEALVHAGFDCFLPGEGVAAFVAATSASERLRALQLVAAQASGAFNLECFNTVVAGMKDADPSVRMLAAVAVVYMPWCEFRDPLSRMAEQESEPDVRKAVVEVLHILLSDFCAECHPPPLLAR